MILLSVPLLFGLAHGGSPEPLVSDPIDVLLSIDEPLVEQAMVLAARAALDEIRPAIDACRDPGTLNWERCLLSSILGNARLTAKPPADEPIANTAAVALVHKSGSCAAVVAVVLALTDAHTPFQAVVLTDHVLLESTRHPGVYYEPLRSGARVDPTFTDLDGSVLVRVGFREYLAYYLDNLAARFALANEAQTSDRLFKDALMLAPGAARVHYNYGLFKRWRGDLSGAGEHARRASELGWPDVKNQATSAVTVLD